MMRNTMLVVLVALGGCGGSDGRTGPPVTAPRLEVCRPTSGAFEWVARFGGPSSGGVADLVTGLAVLADGDFVAIGSIGSPIDFGGGPVSTGPDDSAFLIRLGPGAEHRWSLGFAANPADVRVDASGQVLGVAGPTMPLGQADLGGGPMALGSQQALLGTWDASGSLLGATVAPAGDAIAVGADGAVIVVGRFSGPIMIGAETFVPHPMEGPAAGSYYDAFVARYDGGATTWARQIGGGGFDAAASVAIDETGNVYITGHVERTVDFGGGPMTSGGERDAFVLALDSSGAYRWARLFGGRGTEVAGAVAASSGHVLVAGEFQDTVDFGRGPVDSIGSGDGFLLDLDADGTLRWVKTFGTDGPDRIDAVAANGASARIGIGGTYYGPLDVGGGLLPHVDTRDVLAASFDRDGMHLASGGLGGTTTLDEVRAVALADDGSLYVGGQFTRMLELPGCPLVAEGGDALLAKLRP